MIATSGRFCFLIPACGTAPLEPSSLPRGYEYQVFATFGAILIKLLRFRIGPLCIGTASHFSSFTVPGAIGTAPHLFAVGSDFGFPEG